MRPLLLVMLAVLSLASCRRPASVEKYIFADGSGMYEFQVDMSDSLSVYDISFYTRSDDIEAAGFPMQVRWLSPDGQLYSEEVWFDCGVNVAPYRRGCDPAERGVWKILVRADAPGMRGLGMVAGKRIKDGTR